MACALQRISLSVIIVLVSSEIPTVRDIQAADFESDWFFMEAYTPDAFRRVPHGLSEVPIKVKVLVKPIRGPYQGWIFEAGTSQQADDDLPWLYCGILYAYDVSQVYLSVPVMSNSNYTIGKAFCIDPISWTSNSRPAENQTDNKVLVKVLAWKSSSFPVPDFESQWISTDAREPPYFLEIGHETTNELTLVHVQIRCDIRNVKCYSEGVGAGNSLGTRANYSAVTGLVYAYNNTHTRIWTPNRNYQLLIGATDGYVGSGTCTEGEFRIRGWTSLGQHEQFRITLNQISANNLPDMSALKLNLKLWDPLKSYISVQVKALDGPNEGFVFPAVGQVHRNVFRHVTYGGLVFGYSAEIISIFVPADEHGYIIHVSDNWGTEGYNQTSNNVEIFVRIWNIQGSCSGTKYSTWNSVHCETTHCSTQRRLRCTSSCLSEPDCIAIDHFALDDQCKFMDLETVNNRTMTGLLGTEGELLLEAFKCI